MNEDDIDDSDVTIVHHPKYGGERVILDQIATSYLPLGQVAGGSARDRVFIADQDFWRAASRDELRDTDRITLRRFCLLEWLPSSPGVYHSRYGLIKRIDADDQLIKLDGSDLSFLRDSGSPDTIVYTPRGKFSMLEGGIGCVRLQSKLTEYGKMWFMSASSSATAYAGIPVALTESLYERVIDRIATEGGLWCEIAGQLAFVSDLQDLYRRSAAGPKLVLIADRVDPVQNGQLSDPVAPIASGAITFTIDPASTPRGLVMENSLEPAPNYAYVRFRPGIHGNLERRLPWLEWYVDRVGAATILTDFDEQMTRFQGATFSLNKLSRGAVSQDEFERFLPGSGRQLYIRQAQIQMYLADLRGSIVGDTFSNIGAGATIINRSLLQNALNSVNSHDTELANALQAVAGHVEGSGDTDAADIFDGFIEEIDRSEPRKARLRSFWNGLIEILPTVGQLGEASAKIVEAISQ